MHCSKLGMGDGEGGRSGPGELYVHEVIVAVSPAQFYISASKYIAMYVLCI